MSSVLAELARGNPWTLRNAPVMVEQMLRDPSLVGEVMEVFAGPRQDVQMQARAAYVVEKVSAIDVAAVAPFRDVILEVWPRVEHWLVRSCFCQVVMRLRLGRDERDAVFGMLREFVSRPSRVNSIVVRTNALEAMVVVAGKDAGMREEASEVVEGAPAMRARGRRLWKRLG